MTTYTTPHFADIPSSGRPPRRSEDNADKTGKRSDRAPRIEPGAASALDLADARTPDWAPAAGRGVPKAAVGAVGAALVGGIALAIILLGPTDKVAKPGPDQFAAAQAAHAAASGALPADASSTDVGHTLADAPTAAGPANPTPTEAAATNTLPTPAAATAAIPAVALSPAVAPAATPAPVPPTHPAKRANAPAETPAATPPAEPSQSQSQSAPAATPGVAPVAPPVVEQPAMQQTPAASTVSPSLPTPVPAVPMPATPDSTNPGATSTPASPTTPTPAGDGQ